MFSRMLGMKLIKAPSRQCRSLCQRRQVWRVGRPWRPPRRCLVALAAVAAVVAVAAVAAKASALLAEPRRAAVTPAISAAALMRGAFSRSSWKGNPVRPGALLGMCAPMGLSGSWWPASTPTPQQVGGAPCSRRKACGPSDGATSSSVRTGHHIMVQFGESSSWPTSSTFVSSTPTPFRLWRSLAKQPKAARRRRRPCRRAVVKPARCLASSGSSSGSRSCSGSSSCSAWRSSNSSRGTYSTSSMTWR
mmetsp:Transcript_122772/g.274200  ORF Transcript_122772/g.274200 Transcript_122772/m.274200 type:complete len:248 (+) Transcript_122772:271-1014(+)